VLLDGLPGVVRVDIDMVALLPATNSNFVPIRALRLPAKLRWQPGAARV
jgi:hypothetical protein